jgi:hypothetical protein
MIAIVAAIAMSISNVDAIRSLRSGTDNENGDYSQTPARQLLGASPSQSYWSTIATSQTVWSSTIVTNKWYFADTNGFDSAKNQYVASGFLDVTQDVPHGSGALPVQYQITATKVNAGYTKISIILKTNDKVVGQLTGQTSLLPGTNIKGSAVVHFN